MCSSTYSNPDTAPLPPSKRLHFEEGESTVQSSEEESQAETLQHGTGEVDGGQPLSRSAELDGGQPLSRSGEVDGGQLLNRSGEVDGGQPLNGGRVVVQSPVESWLSGCNRMGQMHVDNDPPLTVTPLPPTDDLTTIHHNIPNTPAIWAALDDCNEGNEMTYPKLVTIKVPIGSELCAEEGVVRVPVRFSSQCEFH